MSNISVDYDILNQKGSPAWYSDTYANIPTAGYKGRMFISTDTYAFYRDTGTGWDLIGGPGTGTITGSGTSGQVSYFNGSSTLAGSNNLFWDNTNSRLGINTTTPGAPLDIHGTGAQIQLNGTGVSNSYIAYQQNNIAKWRVGNFFDGTLNTFAVYNTTLSTNAFSIDNTTNTITFNSVGNFVSVAQTGLNYGALIGKGNTPAAFTSPYVSLYSEATDNNIVFRDGSSKAKLLFNNSTQTYTFPASSGTIALTTDLGSYVTLTTDQTITGNKTFNGSLQTFNAATTFTYATTFMNGSSLNWSAAGSHTAGTLTLSSAHSGATSSLIISDGDTAKHIYLSFTNTATGIKTYTLPDTTGTFALTSDIPANIVTGTGASGQVGYWTGTATQSGSNNHFWDNTNNRLGINTTAPLNALQVVSALGTLVRFGEASGTTGKQMLFGIDSTTGRGEIQAVWQGTANTPLGLNVAGGNVLIGTTTDAGYKLNVSGTGNFSGSLQGASANFSGILEIGTTGLNGKLTIYSGFTSKVGIDMRDSDDASNAYFLFFRKSSGGGIGSIQRAGLTDAVLFNTTSDYRLKEDYKQINGIEKLSLIKVYDFKWKGLNDRMDGVIAHELQEILPYAVSGIKDGLDYQGVDYSKLVPILIKSIQELNDKLIRNNIN